MFFRQIRDPYLAQNAYLVGCQATQEAVVVDPERDVDRYLELAAAEGFRIVAAVETHIHADFLSGARELAHRHGVKLYLSDEGGADWRYEWAQNGDYNRTLLQDGDTFRVGNVEFEALHTPGHTPEHLSFLVIDHGSGVNEPMGLLSGDFVFVGDLGRPDLLESAAGQVGAREPSARELFRSVRQFLDLPDYLQLWPAHGAGSACGKALGAVPTSTVGYEKRWNASISAVKRGEDAFVAAILDGQSEPPLYFGRMKVLNKEGAAVLGELPRPRRVSPAEALADGAVVLDARRDRGEFMRLHLPGAVFAPLGKVFATVAGSYVLPEERIVLMAEEDEVDVLTRVLVRIGLDRVEGFLTPADLAAHAARGGETRTTETIDFHRLEALRGDPEVVVLDVRSAAELAAGSIPGALHVPYTRLLERRAEIPEGRRVLVHCEVAGRAAFAASLIERWGHEAVLVDDAFVNWKQRAIAV